MKYKLEFEGTVLETDKLENLKFFVSVLEKDISETVSEKIPARPRYDFKKTHRPSRAGFKEKLRLVKDDILNTNLTRQELMAKYRISSNSLAKYCKKEFAKRINRKFGKQREKPLKMKKYIRGKLKGEVIDLIKSDKVPDVFTNKDLKEIYNGILHTSQIIAGTRQLESEGFLKIGKMLSKEIGREIYVYEKTRKTVVSKGKKKVFPTQIADEDVFKTLEHAIREGKLSYSKYGRFFGFDMRRKPSTEWVNLISSMAKYVLENKMAKPMLDLTEMSIKFN